MRVCDWVVYDKAVLCLISQVHFFSIYFRTELNNSLMMSEPSRKKLTVNWLFDRNSKMSENLITLYIMGVLKNPVIDFLELNKFLKCKYWLLCTFLGTIFVY